MNSCIGQSSNIGNPPVKNFYKKDYHAGTQNWELAQDSRGVIYVANNEGLLEFDGSNWRLFDFGNETFARSVEIGPDGKIFVGGQNEIGYFKGNNQGLLTYRSLNDLIPENNRKFEDVWDIIVDGETTYFLTWKMIIKWERGEITVPLTGEGYLFFDKIGDRIYLQKADGSFGYFENNIESIFIKLSDFQSEITSLIPYHKDTLLITTESVGISQLVGTTVSQWEVANNDFLKNNRFFCSGLLPDGSIVLGSTTAGVVVVDRNLRIIHHINKSNGLQNNTVLSILINDNGNFWLGLDNGIDLVQANSAFTEFFPDGDIEGTNYTIATYKNSLYAGTNTGIYQIPWKLYYRPEEKNIFREVSNSEGQVWSIEEHDDVLIAGHQKGALVIQDNKAKEVGGPGGVWRFISIGNNQLVAGHYNGLALFEKQKDGVKFISALEGLQESSRLLGNKDENIWMAHPYRGIYKMELDESKKSVSTLKYGVNSGLPSDFQNLLFQLNDRIVFASEKGIYRYDEKRDSFIVDEAFIEVFGNDAHVKYLKEDKKGNIWFAVDDEVGVLWIKDVTIDKKVQKMIIPELSGKLVNSFEYILPINQENILFSTEKGIIHFNPTKYQNSDDQPQIVLSEVWLKGGKDSLIFGGYYSDDSQQIIPEFNHQQNAFDFVFSSTDHEGQDYVQYCYKLIGGNEDWTTWSHNNTLSINNLNAGDYTILIKAKNKLGVESEPVSYQFIIHPPWYGSPIAFGIYTFLLIGSFVGMIVIQNKRHLKEKASIESAFQQEQEKTEALVQESKEKIDFLEREKLETEVQYKNQELAATTMNLLQKSEMLTSIQTSLEKLKKQNGRNDEMSGEINRIIRMVKNENDLSDEWERFTKHFDQVHSDFLKTLGENFPNLSPNDFKLAAYLRMNLSTKEIASLMNISIRGVEAGRYRLRKRLRLGSGENLTEFFMRL